MMNYDSDTKYPPEKKQHKARPFLLTLLGLLLVFGFFFAVMLLFQGGGGQGGDGGSGTGFAGDGPGSGLSGDGPGAGEEGDSIGSGKGEGDGNSDSGEQEKLGEGDGTEEKPPAAPQDALVADSDQDGDTPVEEAVEPEPETPVKMLTLPSEEKKAAPLTSIFPPRNDSTTTASSGTARKASGGGKSGLSGLKGFYGIKIHGNTIFVVDISGSMDGFTKEGHKMEVLKRQLKNAILTTKNGKYYILAFGHGAGGCYSGVLQLFPGDGKMKGFSEGLDKDAEAFVDSLSAGGGTPLLTAMEKVHDLLQDKEIKVKTIIILTDGMPDTPWNMIRDYIRKEIPEKIVINTVSIGMSCTDMQELAKERNGTYSEFL